VLDRDTWLAHEVPRNRFDLTRTQQKLRSSTRFERQRRDAFEPGREYRPRSHSPADPLLMDLRLRSRRGSRAPTVQQRKCEQQADCSRHLPVAGMRWLRAGCAAA
jgi:hypothetical protein